MDILAHSLWTNLAFLKKYPDNKKQRLWAVFFGILPDLISFAPATIFGLFMSIGRNSAGHLLALTGSNFWPFVWARESYNYTHSLVVFLGIFLTVIAVRKGKIYWPLLGWTLHIGIDIFSHKNFYETPFLFPISNYRFSHGMSWGHPVFMAVNYSSLAVVYLVLYFILRRKHGQKN